LEFIKFDVSSTSYYVKVENGARSWKLILEGNGKSWKIFFGKVGTLTYIQAEWPRREMSRAPANAVQDYGIFTLHVSSGGQFELHYGCAVGFFQQNDTVGLQYGCQ